jgi:diguanylate cyclase (GGDEF)-like protein
MGRTLRLLRSQTTLRDLARTDALTGLANVRAFRARLLAEIKQLRRYGAPLTCLMVDVDQLKALNDELGHAAGDQAIATVGRAIREELRETDFGARYGGDEFVALLPHTSIEAGRACAERVARRLAQTELALAGRHVRVGASFGVACLYWDPGDGAEALLMAADRALYDAKRAGGGSVCLAPPMPGP